MCPNYFVSRFRSQAWVLCLALASLAPLTSLARSGSPTVLSHLSLVAPATAQTVNPAVTSVRNTLRSANWQITLRGLGSARQRYTVSWTTYNAKGNWAIATIEVKNLGRARSRDEGFAALLEGLQLVTPDRKIYSHSEVTFPQKTGPFAPGETRQYLLLYDVPGSKPAHLTFRDLANGRTHNIFNVR
jgi:hypothetical protein